MATEREQEMADAIARGEDQDDLGTDDGPYDRPRPPRRAAADVYTFRLHDDRRDQLRTAAQRHGIPPATLIRQWVEERLDVEAIDVHHSANIVTGAPAVQQTRPVGQVVQPGDFDLAIRIVEMIATLASEVLLVSGRGPLPARALGEQFPHGVLPDDVEVELSLLTRQGYRSGSVGGQSRDRHVVPNPDGGWDVRAPGARRASARTATQDEAIQRARAIVRNAGGGEVVVHRRDGKVRSTDTVVPDEARLQRTRE